MEFIHCHQRLAELTLIKTAHVTAQLPAAVVVQHKLQLPEPGLTCFQALFSQLTKMDPCTLKINGDTEFFLFMNLRAEFKIAMFNMNVYKYKLITDVFNTHL